MRDKAAAIFEEARKLWARVSSRGQRPAAKPITEALSSIDVKVGALETQVRRLEEEAAASYDVVQSIAQQHSSLSEQHLQLAQAADEAAARIQRLTRVCIALAALALAGLVLAIVK